MVRICGNNGGEGEKRVHVIIFSTEYSTSLLCKPRPKTTAALVNKKTITLQTERNSLKLLFVNANTDEDEDDSVAVLHPQ